MTDNISLLMMITSLILATALNLFLCKIIRNQFLLLEEQNKHLSEYLDEIMNQNKIITAALVRNTESVETTNDIIQRLILNNA